MPPRRRLPSGVTSAFAQAVLRGVDKAVEHRWEPAVARANAAEGATRQQRVASVTNSFAKELASVGAVTGGTAAVPGVGTAAATAATVTEFAWYTVRASELILTIAAIHGYSEPNIEQRRSWILSVLLYGSSASDGFAKLAQGLGAHAGRTAVDQVPVAIVKRVNAELTKQVAKRYGTRGLASAASRLVPFGIGAALGGVTSYASTRALAKHANKFFGDMPFPDAINTTATDATGRWAPPTRADWDPPQLNP